MKPKLLVLVIVLLLVALVPALAMAQSQAKPQGTGKVILDLSKPIGPQLDAQLGPSAKGPRVLAPGANAPRPSAQGIQPNAVYGLLNDSFEGSLAAWDFFELLNPVGWDSTTYKAKRGIRSLYSAGYNNDPFLNPYYDNWMLSGAFPAMDLQGARRVQARFQYMNDTEFGYDFFLWCVSPNNVTLYCDYHTGSTNNTWRLVKVDSRTNPYLADALDEPQVYFGFLFFSDGSIVDRGTFVDVAHIRAWGP